ncbi:hypothetical protein MNEG_12778, partial [Monoraphidium neglectum]
VRHSRHSQSGPSPSGACAVCGKTPADGAQLRRCAGCGRTTGVMYCGDACCRHHWVRMAHRQQCEAVQLARVVEGLMVAAEMGD